VTLGETLDLRHEGPVVVARLVGEIDLSNAPAIASLVTGAVPNDAAGVVLDLSATTYLDSSGVHLIFQLAERLTDRQQRLALAIPEGSRVRRVLDLVNVSARVPVTPTVEEAKGLVSAGGG
jgi:anti-anti-sigma factor